MVALKSTLRFPYDGNNSLAPRASLWKRIRPSVEGAHFFVCTHRSPVSEHRVTRLWECESSRLRREFVYKGNQKARVQLTSLQRSTSRPAWCFPIKWTGLLMWNHLHCVCYSRHTHAVCLHQTSVLNCIFNAALVSMWLFSHFVLKWETFKATLCKS